MAITREKKDSMYAIYIEFLQKAQGMIITEYRGMTMKNISAVRQILRPIDSSYNVVKTTIFSKALAQTGFAVPDDLLVGPVAVAVAYSDVSKVAKAMLAIKDQPLLVLKGAIMGEQVFRAEQLEALSTMPTLEEARATLIGTLQSPATGLLALLNTPAQNLAMVLKAYTDKQQGGESSAA